MRRSKFMAPKEEKKEPESKKTLPENQFNIALTDDIDRDRMFSAINSSATEINPNLILPNDLAGALIVWRGTTYAIQEMSFNCKILQLVKN